MPPRISPAGPRPLLNVATQTREPEPTPADGGALPAQAADPRETDEVFRALTERPVELLRFATAGSVDDGKSTLIGRLLYDSKQVLADQLAHIELTSQRMGHDFLDLSLLTDGLRAEREQGITIDVAYRYFATAHRRFIIADTPGHEQYTRNMVTGASTADLVVVLVDARKGVLAQSRRHAFIASLLNIPHLVVCINKMDLMGYDEEVFDSIVNEFERFAARLDVKDVTFIPISALRGDNVVERSAEMPWYQGPPLLYHLEHVHIASDRNLIDVRFPVQWVIRPRATAGLVGEAAGPADPGTSAAAALGGAATAAGGAEGRTYAGQLAGGILRAGDEVVVLPGGQRTTVTAIDTFDGPLPEAFPPMSVALRLADEVDVARGSMIARANNQPTVSASFESLICWMSERPLDPRRRYLVKHTTRTALLSALDVRYRIDVDTLHRDEHASVLELNDLGRVRIELTTPLLFDSYRRNRITGSLIVIDEATNETVAAGVILDTEPEADVRDTAAAGAGAAATETKTERSPNVRWEVATMTRRERWDALGCAGATVWFTGLPASGKSTVGRALEQRLVAAGRPAYLLDGDNLRHGLNGDLGFDDAARAENVRRTAHVARLLAESGVIALVSLVSPFAADRELAASLHAAEDINFIEVFVSTPLERCQERDPKGLYARARAGQLPGMTGVGAPYEAPAQPHVVIGACEEEVHDAVDRVLHALAARGLGGAE
jgi:bifunctional enzyme CysN/CysC